LEAWCSAYPSPEREGFISRKVGIVMAGNIPLVGFHDLLCVLFSGHKALVKLSSEDRFLLPAIIEIINSNDHKFNEYIHITSERFTGFDAIIATGSNNTNRYFEYYFGNHPHILRKNRNGIGVLTGLEQESDLEALADDIFLYFGKGCRNISKLYVPTGFRFDRLLKPFSKYLHFTDHNKYRNNLDYQRVVLQMNNIGYVDLGAVLLKEDSAIPSPIAVLHFEFYEEMSGVKERLQGLFDEVQCIVCIDKGLSGWINLGHAQRTGLHDYADGVDTMEFLCNL
ncbi:MAG: acyl-CoA reductase, partial [Bacteroidota bacterium]